MKLRKNGEPWGRQRKTIFSPEQQELLKGDTPIKELSETALFYGFNIAAMHNYRWNYKNPKVNKRPFSEKELEYLAGDSPIETLMKMPLFKGRKKVTMENKRESFQKIEIKKAEKRKVNKLNSKPQARTLYQFISTKDATPARKREWELEERRLMHYERELGYPM